jgi:hypothetical protein
MATPHKADPILLEARSFFPQSDIVCLSLKRPSVRGFWSAVWKLVSKKRHLADPILFEARSFLPKRYFCLSLKRPSVHSFWRLVWKHRLNKRHLVNPILLEARSFLYKILSIYHWSGLAFMVSEVQFGNSSVKKRHLVDPILLEARYLCSFLKNYVHHWKTLAFVPFRNS